MVYTADSCIRVEARGGDSRAEIENSVAHAASALPESKRPDLSVPQSLLALAFAQTLAPVGQEPPRLRRDRIPRERSPVPTEAGPLLGEPILNRLERVEGGVHRVHAVLNADCG